MAWTRNDRMDPRLNFNQIFNFDNLATRTSWNAIADASNEIKNAKWEREVAKPYVSNVKHIQRVFNQRRIIVFAISTISHPPHLRFLHSSMILTCVSPRPREIIAFDHVELCAQLGVSRRDAPAMPQHNTVQAQWVRDMYIVDANERGASVTRELEAGTGTDILTMDWTVDAARRCGGSFLFYVMSSDGVVLMSELTRTTAPSEVHAPLATLKQRGVNPLVVYVDDACCDAWPRLLGMIWPNVHVRLDGMHAIRRLTQTTTSARHPWHGRFCALLSSAIYQSDRQADGASPKLGVGLGTPLLCRGTPRRSTLLDASQSLLS